MRVYQSISHALVELSQAFQQMYSFKKQVLYSSGFGTHMEEMILQLSGAGVSTQNLLPDSSLDEKKILFAVADKEDAITAQDFSAQFPDTASSKVNFIWVHHVSHKIKGMVKEVRDTDIHLFSIAPNLVVAHIGRRLAGLHKGLCPSLDWPLQEEQLKPLTPYAENKKWVESVEAMGVAGSKSFLKKSESRFFDRALIFWDSLESSAVRDVLITQQGMPASAIECLSLHRWNELKILHQFEKRGYAAEVFRGLLIFSSELSKDSRFKEKLETVCKSLVRSGQ